MSVSLKEGEMGLVTRRLDCMCDMSRSSILIFMRYPMIQTFNQNIAITS